jgi:radical SAM protein with 4Fe4S-binding SPASM domain
MLPVSDLLEIVTTKQSGDVLSSKAPQRFSAVGTASPVIIWNVCGHCNMTCPHCYAVATKDPSPRDLTTEEALRLIDDMAEAGIKIVIFSGGEPLLRHDLLELIQHAKNRGLYPQLSTNGTYITDTVAAELADAGVGYVGISIDGLPSFNDEYRGMEGGHDLALRGLQNAKAAGMKTGLRITLTARNADHLDPMLKAAREVSANRFYVSHLLYSGRGFKMSNEDLGQDKTRALLEGLFESAETLLSEGSPTRIVTGSNDSDGPFLLRWIQERYGVDAAIPVEKLLRERGGNSAGEKILNIDHMGKVHPDQFWRQQTLGNVRKDSFAEILKNPFREELAQRASHLTGRCGECRYIDLCRGSHRERAFAEHGDHWASDPACVLLDSEISDSINIIN